ncbi:hypothetical protein [Paracerasibacillus soli]|uniref:Uncharacterized protein n=1 Tax=Paracerasibacillus soli TaxID=480284 RepID=A0ABU5CNE2_9BACI|nr:hypothetical protein [Virgibacillus soli]MDY0407411.1 hypothetical protein [Virgibacillus soli]
MKKQPSKSTKPVAVSHKKPATKPATKPVTKPAAKPVSKPKPKPVTKPKPKPVTKPKPQPKPQPKPVASSYISASQARSILSASPLSGSGSSYSLRDSWGPIVSVTVGSDHVKSVSFNGTTYYTDKNTTLQDCIDGWGRKRGERYMNLV